MSNRLGAGFRSVVRSTVPCRAVCCRLHHTDCPTATPRRSETRSIVSRQSERHRTGSTALISICFRVVWLDLQTGSLTKGRLTTPPDTVRCRLVGTIVPCRHPGTPQHKSSGDNGPGLEPTGPSPSREKPTTKCGDQGQDPQFSLLGPSK